MAFEKVLLDFFLMFRKKSPHMSQVHNQGIEIHQKNLLRAAF